MFAMVRASNKVDSQRVCNTSWLRAKLDMQEVFSLKCVKVL